MQRCSRCIEVNWKWQEAEFYLSYYVIPPYDYKRKFIMFMKRNIGRINWRLIKINTYGGEEQMNEEDGGKARLF